MPPKIDKKVSANDASAKEKRWTGKEQKTLDKLFKDGLITEFDKPWRVKRMDKIFEPISARNFRKHFAKSKEERGFNLKPFDKEDFEDEDYADENEDDLYASFPGSSSKQVQEESSHGIVNIAFGKPPYLMRDYICPTTQVPKLVVVINLFSGVKNISFELKCDGKLLVGTYKWATPAFNPEMLYTANIDTHLPLKEQEAQKAALELALQGYRTHKAAPVFGTVEVPIAMKVQTENNTWQTELFKLTSGEVFARVTFSGYTDSYYENKANKSMELLD